MDLDPTKWGGLELGLKICPVKTSTEAVCADIALQALPLAARRSPVRGVAMFWLPPLWSNFGIRPAACCDQVSKVSGKYRPSSVSEACWRRYLVPVACFRHYVSTIRQAVKLLLLMHAVTGGSSRRFCGTCQLADNSGNWHGGNKPWPKAWKV